MADSPRLTSADYVLIHAVGFLCTRPITSDEWAPLTIELIQKALPKVSQGNPMMAAFAQIAADIAASGGPGSGAPWISAREAGRRALERFHQARMAEAWDVFKKGAANG